jgi:pyruvate ferredoxin oxidoreductase beta subunit
MVLMAAERPVVASCATGCLEVVTTIYPYTAWNVPYIHNAFENSASTMSGVEAGYTALRRRGKVTKDIDFIAFGGDGGTYDIGLQALSGAAERGHRMLYVCYDNEAYMNTGIQRSSATPLGVATNTSPSGVVIPGKQQSRKDLTEVMAAHSIPYVAQAAPHNWRDLVTKVRKALAKDGPSFLNVLQPCFRGWRYPGEDTIEISRLAADTCFWPLYEVDEGVYRITYRPKEKKPMLDWVKSQGRYRHLLGGRNEALLGKIQQEIDHKWKKLQIMEELTNREDY